MRIALAQIEALRGQLEKNIHIHIDFIRRASTLGADFIFFPELSLTGYEPSLAKRLGVYPGERRLDVFQEHSDTSNLVIGLGAPVIMDQGTAIGMFLFEPGKGRKIYFKKYLHEDELPYFVSGQDFSGHFQTEPKLSLAICYEISVEDHLEEAIRNQAQIYVASVAKFRTGIGAARLRLEDIAKKHNLMVMMVNSVGEADGSITAGLSAVWGKGGELLGQLDDQNPGLLLYDTVTGIVTRDDSY